MTYPSYQSKALERPITVSDLLGLPESQLRALHAELQIVVPGLDSALEVAANSHDRDWKHRITKKLAICRAFLAQTGPLVEALQRPAVDPLTALYLAELERVIEDEVGPFVAEQLRVEARQAAQRAVGTTAEPPQAPAQVA